MSNWPNQIPNCCREMQTSAKNENDQPQKIVFPVLPFGLVQFPTILRHGTLPNSVGKNIISSLRIQFWLLQIQTLSCLIKDTKSRERKSEKSDFEEEAFYLSNLLVKWLDFFYGKSLYTYKNFNFWNLIIIHWLILCILDFVIVQNDVSGMQFYRLKVYHPNFLLDQLIHQWRRLICHHQKCTVVRQQQVAASQLEHRLQHKPKVDDLDWVQLITVSLSKKIRHQHHHVVEDDL